MNSTQLLTADWDRLLVCVRRPDGAAIRFYSALDAPILR